MPERCYTHGTAERCIPPSGRPVEVVICNVMELRDGKIHREREYVDLMSILTQIGAAPVSM